MEIKQIITIVSNIIKYWQVEKSHQRQDFANASVLKTVLYFFILSVRMIVE